VPPKPNKDAAKVEEKLDKSFGKEKRGRDIIKQGRARLYPWEILRLKNESKIFWDVYYKEKAASGPKKQDPKKKAAQEAKIFLDVQSKALHKLDKDKAKQEAKVFWEVYYELKKKKEPKIDKKPKTKITPAKKAIAGATDTKKVPKKKGWFMQLIAMLRPFITSLITAFGPFILKIAAIALAIGVAIDRIRALIPIAKDAHQNITDANELAKDNRAATERLNKKDRDELAKKRKEAEKLEGEEKARAERKLAAEEIQQKLTENKRKSEDRALEKLIPGHGAGILETLGATVNIFKNIKTKSPMESIDEVTEMGNAIRNSRMLTERRIGRDAGDPLREVMARINRVDTRTDEELMELYGPGGKFGGGEGTPGGIEAFRNLWEEHIKKKFMKGFGSRYVDQPFIYGDSIAAEEARNLAFAKGSKTRVTRRKAITGSDRNAFGGDIRVEMKAEEAYNKFIKDRAADRAKAMLEYKGIIKEFDKKSDRRFNRPTGSGGVGGWGPASAWNAGIGRENNDFVLRPGMPPVSFNSQDTLFGFKAGGPISDFLRAGSAFAGYQLGAINRSNEYLKTLVDLTRGLLAKSGGGGSTNIVPVPMPGSSSRGGDVAISNPGVGRDSRGDAHDAPYSLNVPPVLAS